MAFVYKSEKKPKEKNCDFYNLGPGKYLSHVNYKFKESSVGFLSKSDKITFLKCEKMKQNPHIDFALMSNFTNSHLLQESFEIKPSQTRQKIQNKSQNSIFKSSTKRFEAIQKNEDFPGPGTYSLNNIERKEMKKKENFDKGNIIDEIMNKGNYQPIPSIPSTLHAMGYSECESDKNI